MKIAITCYPTYGGSGVVATELGIELAARGHEIHFISYAMPIRLSATSERIFFHEVEVTTYPLFDHPPYTLALATKMIHPKYAIPVHYGTIPQLAGTPEEYKAALGATKTKVIVMTPGETRVF